MTYCKACGANCDGCQTIPAITKYELTVLKADNDRNLQWLRNMEREVARMQPVFNAAVAYGAVVPLLGPHDEEWRVLINAVRELKP